jgi:hypothetical protein
VVFPAPSDTSAGLAVAAIPTSLWRRPTSADSYAGRGARKRPLRSESSIALAWAGGVGGDSLTAQPQNPKTIG